MAVSKCPPSSMEASQSLRVSGKGGLWGQWAWEGPLEQGTGVPAQGQKPHLPLVPAVPPFVRQGPRAAHLGGQRCSHQASQGP